MERVQAHFENADDAVTLGMSNVTWTRYLLDGLAVMKFDNGMPDTFLEGLAVTLSDRLDLVHQCFEYLSDDYSARQKADKAAARSKADGNAGRHTSA